MESCAKFLAALQNVAQENYAIQFPVVECPAPKFAVESGSHSSLTLSLTLTLSLLSLLVCEND